MNISSHEILLEAHFFEYLDDGISPEFTPLVQHTRGLLDLAPLVAGQFGLSIEEAEEAIEAAVWEIRL
jgi:hypothetical protein